MQEERKSCTASQQVSEAACTELTAKQSMVLGIAKAEQEAEFLSFINESSMHQSETTTMPQREEKKADFEDS